MDFATALLDTVRERRLLAGLAVSTAGLIAHNVVTRLRRRARRVPPGPVGVPLLGCLPHFGLDLLAFLKSLGAYGPVAYFAMGAAGFAALNDARLARQVMAHPDALFRPLPGDSIGFINGQEWTRRRRAVVHKMLAAVSGDALAQAVAACVVEDVFPELSAAAAKGAPWRAAPACEHVSFNGLFSAAFDGARRAKGDADTRRVAAANHKFVMAIAVAMVTTLCLPFFSQADHDMVAAQQVWPDVLAKWLQEAKEQGRDCLATRMEAAGLPLPDVGVLFAAGLHTTSMGLEVGLQLAADYPDVQDEVAAEVLANVPWAKGGKVARSALKQCPKLRAFTHEVLRLAVLAPAGIPRQTTADVALPTGDVLPKGTVVVPNVYWMHYNPGSCWRAPSDGLHLDNWRRPSAEEGKFEFTVAEHFFPFSHGRRDCVGREVATELLELSFALLLANFRFADKCNKGQARPLRFKVDITAYLDPPAVLHVSARE